MKSIEEEKSLQHNVYFHQFTRSRASVPDNPYVYTTVIMSAFACRVRVKEVDAEQPGQTL
jgi:hypothetical protein